LILNDLVLMENLHLRSPGNFVTWCPEEDLKRLEDKGSIPLIIIHIKLILNIFII